MCHGGCRCATTALACDVTGRCLRVRDATPGTSLIHPLPSTAPNLTPVHECLTYATKMSEAFERERYGSREQTRAPARIHPSH